MSSSFPLEVVNSPGNVRLHMQVCVDTARVRKGDTTVRIVERHLSLHHAKTRTC